MINVNLYQLRMQHKLTQEQVAEKINVSRQVIAKWEKGDSVPDLHHSMALAQLFNVTLDNLVNYQNPEEGSLPVPPKGKHFFGVVTIGERGQIVIPKKARDVFHLKPGDSLIIVGDDERGLALVPEKMMSSFFNIVKTAIDEAED